MAGKVIPFPVAASRASEPVAILARHRVLVEVGRSRYEVDVMGFVTRLQPATTDGGRSVRCLMTGSGTEREAPVGVQVLEWSQSQGQGWRAVLKLEGSKEAWEVYWRRLGIAGCSPQMAAEKRGKIPLAMWPRPSDESSCATSAQKEEEHMTNVENRDPAPQEGTPVPASAAKPVKAARKARGAKGTPKGPKQGASEPRTAGSRAGAKSVKKGPKAAARKPRPESKGAKILQLIGRAKGATLSEIMQATSWQAHSVRGFLSTAAKKQGVKIASLHNDAGARVYKLER